MTDRIDHAAEARVLEKNAWERGGPFGDALIRRPVERRDMLASAQVHATLALVEQQRIANLIAMRQSDSDLIPDEEWDHVNASIREGLGL